MRTALPLVSARLSKLQFSFLNHKMEIYVNISLIAVFSIFYWLEITI